MARTQNDAIVVMGCLLLSMAHPGLWQGDLTTMRVPVVRGLRVVICWYGSDEAYYLGLILGACLLAITLGAFVTAQLNGAPDPLPIEPGLWCGLDTAC